VSTAPQTAFCGKAVVKSDVSQALVGKFDRQHRGICEVIKERDFRLEC